MGRLNRLAKQAEVSGIGSSNHCCFAHLRSWIFFNFLFYNFTLPRIERSFTSGTQMFISHPSQLPRNKDHLVFGSVWWGGLQSCWKERLCSDNSTYSQSSKWGKCWSIALATTDLPSATQSTNKEISPRDISPFMIRWTMVCRNRPRGLFYKHFIAIT